MAPPMLFGFDGTWNQWATGTNVTRFVKAYQKANGDAAGCYLRGVRGGVTGLGGRKQVRKAYQGLCNNRSSAASDGIAVVGFSRGGAAAVHFANVVHRYGIREPRRWRLGHCWKLYETGLGFTWGFNWSKLPEGASTQCTIHFLGLWDTVSSLVLPLDLRVADIQRWRFGFAMAVPPNVVRCSHAMALDERRKTFRNRRFDNAAARELHKEEILQRLHAAMFPVLFAVFGMLIGDLNSRTRTFPLGLFVLGAAGILAAIQYVRWRRSEPQDSSEAGTTIEVWFRGVHRDIGGAGASSGLSDLALKWMIDQARMAGLPIDRSNFDPALRPLPSSEISGSLDPWLSDPAPRTILEGDRAHKSVVPSVTGSDHFSSPNTIVRFVKVWQWWSPPPVRDVFRSNQPSPEEGYFRLKLQRGHSKVIQDSDDQVEEVLRKD